MSAEARMLDLVSDAVRRETQPLKELVEDLSARLAAVEGGGGPSGAAPQKRAASGRTAKARASSAETTATAPEPKTESGEEAK